MASAIEFPVKSTRRMTETDLREEAARFGIPPSDDVQAVRSALKSELERRWLTENADGIAAFNRWFEKNGLPFEDLRLQ